MTAKHRTPEWKRTVYIVRGQVTAARKRGDEVVCWRCGYPIDPEQRYDVGHLDPMGGEGLDNAAPEHRGENRREGGRRGARVTNERRRATSGGFVRLPWASSAPGQPALRAPVVPVDDPTESEVA